MDPPISDLTADFLIQLLVSSRPRDMGLLALAVIAILWADQY